MNKKSFMSVSPAQRQIVEFHLCGVLACLRAQSLSYQTSHWQAKGDDYYGNHLLFMRLYESVGEQIDSLAEKMVGYMGEESVELQHQMERVLEYTGSWAGVPCHLSRGLQSEMDLQSALRVAYDDIKESGAMTLGLDDWIMATANAHESNEYLLQQALNRNGSQKLAKQAKYEVHILQRGHHEVLYMSNWSKILGIVKKKKSEGFDGYIVRTDDGKELWFHEVLALNRAPQWHTASDSGAPSAEGEFFDNPEKREVLELAETGAISNIPEVAEAASEDDSLDVSEAQAVSEAEAAPPTPEEIKDEVGGSTLSTLNRMVVESEDPDAAEAAKLNNSKMAAWLRSLK